MGLSRVAPVRLGKYEVHGLIANGGMSRVHLGLAYGAAGFRRPVAIKRLHPEYARNREFAAMLIDEARLASAIRHRNVVAVLDVGEADGELFLVLEPVVGVTLAEVSSIAARAGEPMPVEIALAVMIDALEGLHAAHEAWGEAGPLGIVHRDVSPQNLLIGADGLTRVLDFGIARAASRAQTTREGVVKGKLGYLSPEQLRALPVDRRTDVYAAALVLWETLAGRRGFARATPDETMAAVLQGELPRLTELRADVPRALDDTIRQALAMSPADRPETARAFAQALERQGLPARLSEVERWVARHVRDRCEALAAALRAVESAVPADPAPLDVPTSVMGPDAGRSGTRWRAMGVVALVSALGVSGLALVRTQREPVSAGEPGPLPTASQPPGEPPAPTVAPVRSDPPAESVAPALPLAPEPAASRAPADQRKDLAARARRGKKPVEPSCEPPYVIVDGIKAFKRECIR